ncbi:MAG TPA: hypothetical protein VFV97_14810 [Rhodanobacteraceae bacterium]|nr:hypothetical protein [Rhodanobacteraceae bacterium]
MRNVRIAIAVLMATAAPSMASDRTDVMEAVHRWTDAFGRGTFATESAPCTADAVVIDDFQPHVWQGPGACSAWFNAFEAWASKASVTDAVIKVGAIRHLDFDAGFAYLVAPVTLSYVKAGRPVDLLGTLTLTLRKRETVWLVSGVAWADR